MSRPAIVQSNVAVELKPAPINPDWILEGSPTARNAQLASSGDRQSRTLVWDCSAGKFMWRYDEDETIHILKGLVVLDDGVGTPRELGPGDVVFFPAGAVVKWHVKEHVRKLAFFRRALPRPIILALGAMRRLRRLARRATAFATGAFTIGSVGAAGEVERLARDAQSI